MLKVEGAIDRPLADYLRDRLASAEADGAIVVLQIDTSGTIDQDGVALAQQVVDLDVPVIAWVGPAPAAASGAGLLLMYASSLAAVSPGSQTGPLNPIDLADPDQVYPDLNTTIQGWLDERDKDTSLDWEDAAPACPGGAGSSDRDGGRTVGARTAQRDRRGDGADGIGAGHAADPHRHHRASRPDERTVDIRFDAMGPLERVAHGVSSPSMVYFLLVIGLACLAFELTQPGFGFAGFAGVGMVALAAYGIWVVPPWWPGMIALVGGVALMTLDVRMRRLGPYTVIGLLAFAAGVGVRVEGRRRAHRRSRPG